VKSSGTVIVKSAPKSFASKLYTHACKGK